MNREDIIRMAREAGIGETSARFMVNLWEIGFEAGAAAEREACAKVCESMRPTEREFDQRFYTACTLNANAIRARSNT